MAKILMIGNEAFGKEKCIGCASCALMCPDVVITVERD